MKDRVLLIVALFITSSCATTNMSLKKISLLNVMSDGDLFIIKSQKSLCSVNIDSL